MDVVFEWDRRKVRLNLAKHGVTFEEATRAFVDPLAKIFEDVDHSVAEHREILIGHSDPARLLVVCFVEKPTGVRLISARPATPRERYDYEENR